MNGRKTSLQTKWQRQTERILSRFSNTCMVKASPAPSSMSVPLLPFNSPQTHTHTSSLLTKQQTTNLVWTQPIPSTQWQVLYCNMKRAHMPSDHPLTAQKGKTKHGESILSFLFPCHCSKHSIHRAVGMRLGVSVNDTDIKQCLSPAAIHFLLRIFNYWKINLLSNTHPNYNYNENNKNRYSLRTGFIL